MATQARPGDTRGCSASPGRHRCLSLPALAREHRPVGAEARQPACVDLYWLPLGAGGHFVRLNGRAFEALAARLEHRRARDLYHSALEVSLGRERFTIEQAPVWNAKVPDRGVVGEGPVGSPWLGRLGLFRYEVRRWRDGAIPDVAQAVDSPRRLTTDAERAAALLDLVPQSPTVTWGRDELETGEMWNSNSLISWLLARSGHDVEAIAPPANGRAPGWAAGLVVAATHPEYGSRS